MLDAQVSKAEKSRILLTQGTLKRPVLPTDLRVKIDVTSSVDAAMAVTRSGNVFSNIITRFKLYFSKREVALKGTVDTQAMDALLADLSQELDVVPINAGLKVKNGDVLVVESKDGYRRGQAGPARLPQGPSAHAPRHGTPHSDGGHRTGHQG